MHRTTLWRRRQKGVISKRTKKKGRLISKGKKINSLRISKILKICCQLIHSKVCNEYGMASDETIRMARKRISSFAISINLFAVACGDICGHPRKRGPRSDHLLRSISYNRKCPTQHFDNLNRPLVHYWRHHKDFPLARAVVKSIIKEVEILEQASEASPLQSSVAKTSRFSDFPSFAILPEVTKDWVMEKIIRTIFVCFDPSEKETRRNLQTIFCLHHGEMLDKKRAHKLASEQEKISTEELIYRFTETWNRLI